MGIVFTFLGVVGVLGSLSVLYSFWNDFDDPKESKRFRIKCVVGLVISILIFSIPLYKDEEVVVEKTAITNYIEVSDTMSITISGDPMKVTWEEVKGKHWWTLKASENMKKRNFRFEYTFEVSK